MTALGQITIDVYKGATGSIIGESGCGKSTLAQTVGMLLAPDSGTVKLNGQDVYRLRTLENWRSAGKCVWSSRITLDQ